MIRTCGKCKVRILKEDGCNKVICTKCYAVLCDYCGKDITKQMYNHFDGQGRAPPGANTEDKTGKCPLYDESHKRKDQQVDNAGKEAMAKVRAEHPDLSEEDLKIKFAKGVQSSSNRNLEDRLPHLHAFHGDMPPHHNHHRRHHGHGMGDAALAALYNREPDAAFEAMFDGDLVDEFGVIAPGAVQQAREQGRQAREQLTAAHLQVHQQQIALLRQQRQAAQLAQRQAFMAQQQAQRQAALAQQQAVREDLQRRLEHARQNAGRNEASQAHRALAADPLFAPFANGLQAADVLKSRQNDLAFGNNAGVQDVPIIDDVQARRALNIARQRNVEEPLRGFGGAIDFLPAQQRQDINDFRRRTAELNAERTAERVGEGNPYGSDFFGLDPPQRMPEQYPRAPRRRNALIPGEFQTFL